jgi:hypothetical protein
MNSQELDIIRTAVVAGHPLAIQDLKTLEAEAVSAAAADEEEERAAQYRQTAFDMFESIEEEEPSKHKEVSELDSYLDKMQVEDSPTMEESQETEEEKQLDLMDVEIINKNTSHSKAADATSTRRVYKRVYNAFQKFLVVVENHPSNAGLSSFKGFLPDQTHDYVNRKLVRLFVKTCVRSL